MTKWSQIPTISESRIKHRVTRWRSWLRPCATGQKVADSIPDGVTGILFVCTTIQPWYSDNGITQSYYVSV